MLLSLWGPMASHSWKRERRVFLSWTLKNLSYKISPQRENLWRKSKDNIQQVFQTKKNFLLFLPTSRRKGKAGNVCFKTWICELRLNFNLREAFKIIVFFSNIQTLQTWKWFQFSGREKAHSGRQCFQQLFEDWIHFQAFKVRLSLN